MHKPIYLKGYSSLRTNICAGVKPLNVEMKNFNLCLYIEDLFRFFINNPFKYDNLQKVIDFISLPTDLQTIDQQIENLKMVYLESKFSSGNRNV
ncbi:conserved protein of unknown function [Shewanella benthica]|uniref:Uncharacterized protein n=1 Tax=Shewanella benthica TaxID=43661 RepID=A0A330M0J2_9GAMM|nr:conserved protein of unknown function [Shewanella benthica]